MLRSLEAGGDTAEILRGLGDSLDVADLASVLGCCARSTATAARSVSH